MLLRRSRVVLGSVLVALVAYAAGCGSSADDKEGPVDPRLEHLSGTGTVDNVVLEALAPHAVDQGVKWWEVELRLADDDISQSGVISTDDSMRVTVDFWGHGADNAVRVEGRFALDVSRWLGLPLERDPSDVAAIFEGSRVSLRGSTAALAPEETEKWLADVLAALSSGQSQVASALAKTSAALDGPLGTCVGSAKSAIKGALSGIGSAFSSCAKCASSTLSSGGNPDSDASWAACNTCEKGITDAKKAAGLFDYLSCKKALVLPPVGGGGDADDAGGTVVTLPPVTESTCYAQSADKVKGTFRVTDGKGGVACSDCPAGTVPFESKLGCAPAAKPLPPEATAEEQAAWSPVDESNAIVLVPQGEGRPGTPRVVTSDVCVTVDVSGTGTVNSIPVQSGTQRVNYKLGRRSWGALPKNVQTSKDTSDLTAATHTGQTKGRYAIQSTQAASRPTPSAATGTVEQAIARGGCASRPVFGLSQQILDELSRCVRPGFLVRVPSGGSLTNNADHGYMEKPAADAIAAALRARPGRSLRISSMYRTIAQQYFLYRRASCFPAVSRPGRSNHESGIAIDVSDPDNSTWRTALTNAGFKWLGSWDRFHFDYKGPGSVDLRGEDVKAFQRLWNRNHPEDKIGEDGVWGGETETRMKKSPAAGFPIGVPDTCEAVTPAPANTGSREPYEYVTNVTTADLLPGEGCETGSDASHTSVDACISVKQVCEPFWCDLADQRTAACR